MGLRRNVGPHRVPGICISLMGFMLLFAGVMMIAMAETTQNINQTDVKIGGGVCLVLGVASVSGGFIYQYIVHREFKKRQAAKQQRRKANKEIISARAAAYLENNPMEGTSGSMVDLNITSPRGDEFGSVNGLPNHMDDDDIMADEEDGEFTPYNIFQVYPGESPDRYDPTTPRSQHTTPRIICQTVIEDDNTSSDEEYDYTNGQNNLHVGDFVVERSASQPSVRSSEIGSSTGSVGNRAIDDSDDDVSLTKINRKDRRRSNNSISVERTGSSVSIRSSRSDLNDTLKDLDDELEDNTVMRRKKRRKRTDASSKSPSPVGDENNSVNGSELKVQGKNEDLNKTVVNNLRKDVQKTKFRQTSKGKATAGSRIKGIYAKKCDEVVTAKQTHEPLKKSNSNPEEIVDKNTSTDMQTNRNKKGSMSDTENWDSSDCEKDEVNDKFKIKNGVIEHSPSVIEKYLQEESRDSVIPMHEIQSKARLQREYSNWDSENENDFSDADTITMNGGISDTMPDMSLPDLGAETCDSRCS